MITCATLIIASATTLWSTPSTIREDGCHRLVRPSPVWAMDGAGGVAEEAKDPGGVPPVPDPLDLEVTLHLTKVDLCDLATFLTDQVGIAVRIDPHVGRYNTSMEVESMPLRRVLGILREGCSLRLSQALDGTLILSDPAQPLAGTHPLNPPAAQNASKRIGPVPDPLRVVLSNESAETLLSTVMSPFYDKPQPRVPGLPGTVTASFEITSSMDWYETLSLFMNRRPSPLRRPIAPAWKAASMATVLADLSRAAGVTIAMSPRDLEDAPSITWDEPVTEVGRVMETLSRSMNLSYTATTRGFLLTSFGSEARTKVVGTVLEIPAALADRLISIDVRDGDPYAVALALNKALAVPVSISPIPTWRHVTLNVQNRSVDDIVKMITICAGGSWSAQLGADKILLVDIVATQPPGGDPEAAAPAGAPQF